MSLVQLETLAAHIAPATAAVTTVAGNATAAAGMQ